MKLKSIDYTKKEIINFCIKNIQEIWNKITENGDYENIDFDLNISGSATSSDSNKINFKFMGKGTFGIVLRVALKEISLIIKIMKVKNDEPERCQKILKKINYLNNSPSEKSKKKLKLIEKYLTQIYSISENKTIEMIFFEYLDGSNLKDFINEKYISQDEVNLIFLKTLIGVRLFHKFLKLSHRDLKLENLFIEKNNNVKIIDYGFVCDRDNVECYNKYQGTSKYIHPRMNEEEILLYEKSLSGAEIEDLISSARKAAQKIKNDRKRPEAERNDAEDVLDFIKDIKDVWDRKNNLHPNQVNALMRIVAGVNSGRYGFMNPPDGKVPSNYRNEEELNESRTKRGLSDAVIKAGALQAKRWILQQGREGDVSGQLNGIASLLLFNMALTDRGASFMSKALATSAFFKERGK